MKVSERAVDLKSERNYSQYQNNRIESTSMRMSNGKDYFDASEEEAAKMSISEESQSLFDRLKEQKQSGTESLSEEVQKVEKAVSEMRVEDEQTVETVRNLFGMIEQVRGTDTVLSASKMRQMKVQDIMKQDKFFSASVVRSDQSFGLSQQLNVVDLRTSDASEMSKDVFIKTGNVVSDYNAWVRRNMYASDSEGVIFSTTGVAKTAEGKDVPFGMELELPSEIEDSFIGTERADVIITDALHIHLGNRKANVSDMKFSLEFERNEKEVDDDLNKSVREYQESEDKKDWVFKNIKVWTMDDEGKGKIVELKGADVGVICLRSANKQFRLNNTNNMTNAMIQKNEAFQKNRMAERNLHMNLAV